MAKHNMRILCAVLCLLIPSFSVSAQALVQETQAFRERLYTGTDINVMLADIKAFRESKAQALLQASEEERLTVTNILALEEANFISYLDNGWRERYVILNEQEKQNAQFIKGKKPKDLSPAFLISYADLLMRIFPYIPGAQVRSKSMEVKELYQAALKKDKKSSPALSGYGLWLSFAPPIAGGGYNEALKTLIKAERAAKTDSELYTALIYKSQILFSLGRADESKEALRTAHALFPAEVLTSLMEEANASGRSFFN